MQNAFLAITGSLGIAAALLWVLVTMAEQNQREAGRIVINAQKGTGYLATVTTSLASIQGRPRGY